LASLLIIAKGNVVTTTNKVRSQFDNYTKVKADLRYALKGELRGTVKFSHEVK
jgi:hypothetical protein